MVTRSNSQRIQSGFKLKNSRLKDPNQKGEAILWQEQRREYLSD